MLCTNKIEEMAEYFIYNKEDRTSETEVRWVKKAYRGLIFTELDKNVNQWSIKCPTIYAKDMVATFGKQVKNYETITVDEESIKEKIEKDYKSRKLDIICVGKKKWTMNFPRVVSKDKDITRCSL